MTAGNAALPRSAILDTDLLQGDDIMINRSAAVALRRPVAIRAAQPPTPPAAVGDVRQVLAHVGKRRRLFAGVAGAILAATIVATLVTPPRYTATAQVELKARPDQTLSLTQTPDQPVSPSAADNEVEVLKSRFLADSVAATLPPSVAKALTPPTNTRPNPLKALFTGVGQGSSHQAKSARDALSSRLQHDLSVSRSGLTNVIDVSFTAKDPALAALVANTVVQRYVDEQVLAKDNESRQASAWLGERLGGMQDAVQAAEGRVENYRAAHGLLSASGATLTEQSISSLSTELAQARIDQATAEAKLATATRQLSQGSSGDDVGEALSSAVVQTLRGQRAQISRDLADMETRYGPMHPQLVKTRRQLEDIDGQIAAEIHRVTSNLAAQVEVARTRTASIQGSLGAARSELAGDNRATVGLKELERKAEATRAPYQSYLERFKQTAAQQGIELADSRVLSRALAPLAPSSPNILRNLLIGLVLALGGAFGAVVVREFFDNGFSTGQELEQSLKLPSLATIPLLSSTINRAGARRLQPTRFLVEEPLSAFTEAFRNLRTSIQSPAAPAPQVVAVTSSLPGEGKTTTSICLGKAIAVAGRSVVIVECDVRRPSFKRFIQPRDHGLLAVLSGEVPLDHALVQDDATPLVFLPIGRTERPDGEPLMNPALDHLLDELRARYDVVLLDTPPALALADTRILAAKAEAVLYLVRWRKTARQAVELGLSQLISGGAQICGVALTRVDLREQARAGYGDAAYYYGSYKKYYS
jgi:succinoglycan biosynthesis transport protein ExoP